MIVVIGGSLGGCEALQAILRRLPADFPAPIVVALHRHLDSVGLLAPVVQLDCALAVTEAEDKEPIEPGHVYLAPADYHLLLDGGALSLSTDEPVNYARPAIDVLFQSAAEWRGREVVAVVLTGAGSDGAAGAKRILERGGTVLVQDPKTAEGLWMPAATIERTGTEHVLTLEGIAKWLAAAAGRTKQGDRPRG
jgi:two-component system, chemotaxis family, protein-glutamate methylesterase/glutaminase